MSGENRIVPLNGAAPQAQIPMVQKHNFQVFLRAPGISDGRMVAEIQTSDVRCAVLAFLAQIAGDVSQIRELRVVRKDSGIITPA